MADDLAPRHELLLHAGACWPLPGLGLLVLPAAPAPALAGYALHTALAVQLELPAGAQPATATVEEITREAEARRGLLLHDVNLPMLPAGTAVWLVAEGAV